MKIALISYEYPPDTGWGGIGTYAFQAASLLAQRGNDVEVFAASPDRQGVFHQDGVVIHRVRELQRMRFNHAVGCRFLARHHEVKFDVLECPEYLHEGSEANKLAPTVPLVVKLHSPSVLLADLCGSIDDSLGADLRSYGPQTAAMLGAILHGRPWPGFHLRHCQRKMAQYRDQLEANLTRKADVVVSPTRALLEMQMEAWSLDPQRCRVIPNPFVPSAQLLEIEPSPINKTIVFLGRLEVRKGVLDLAEALPSVLDEFPDWSVCFAGRSVPIPHLGVDAREYIQARLARFGERVQFTGAYTATDLRGILGKAAICVFPSKWENFPNVCLEAMSAGCAVIGSATGGMAEIITDGVNGLLVPANAPESIANRLRALIKDPETRVRFGRLARESVLTRYNKEVCGSELEDSYRQAIQAKCAGNAAANQGGE